MSLLHASLRLWWFLNRVSEILIWALEALIYNFVFFLGLQKHYCRSYATVEKPYRPLVTPPKVQCAATFVSVGSYIYHWNHTMTVQWRLVHFRRYSTFWNIWNPIRVFQFINAIFATAVSNLWSIFDITWHGFISGKIIITRILRIWRRSIELVLWTWLANATSPGNSVKSWKGKWCVFSKKHLLRAAMENIAPYWLSGEDCLDIKILLGVTDLRKELVGIQ